MSSLLLLMFLPFWLLLQLPLWLLLLPLAFFPEFRQRLGWAPRLAQRPVWFHGASLGEWQVIAILASGLETVPRTATWMSRNAARHGVGEGFDAAAYLPLDLWPAHLLRLWLWRPAVVVLVEVDIWPMWMLLIRLFGIPLMWVNARGDHSAGRLIEYSPLIARLLFGRARIIHCVDEETESAWHRAGLRKARAGGNLKWPMEIVDLAGDEGCRNPWSKWIGQRCAVILASVHVDEAEVIRRTVAWAEQNPQGRCVVVAPRHLEEIPDILALLPVRGGGQEKAWKMVQEFGILEQIYPFCHTAVIGGTFDHTGGHNPVEPALFGCYILVGPHQQAQAAGIRLLQLVKAVQTVDSAVELSANLPVGVGERFDPSALRELIRPVEQEVARLQQQIRDLLT